VFLEKELGVMAHHTTRVKILKEIFDQHEVLDAKSHCRSRLSNKGQNLIGIWDASGLLFGIYQHVVKQNFEVASVPSPEGDGGPCIDAQSVRKTCGAFFIAHSQVAVDDLYLHCVAPGCHRAYF